MDEEKAEIITMGKNEKINPDMAESEFQRFAEAWDIELDLEGFSSEDKDEYDTQKRRIIRAIMKGRAFISDEGLTVTYELIQPIAETSKIEMNIPKGDAYLAMDKFKEKQGIHKLNAFMAASSKVNPKIFSSMDGRDLKFFQAVTTLFFAS